MGLGLELAGPALGVAGAWYDQRKTDKRQHEANAFNAQEAAVNRAFQAKQAEMDRALQREFAENGIRMRVADAEAAGLHPLVGAGVQPVSYQPIGVGGSQATSGGYSPSTMGQDISRAISATRTATERQQDILRTKLLQAQVDEADMRNLMLANKVGESMQNNQKPPMPDMIKPTAPEQYSRDSKDPSRVAANNPLWQKTEIAPGVFWDLPYSQGESPLEALEGATPQALALWKNLWYNPQQVRKAKFKAMQERIRREYREVYRGQIKSMSAH